MTTSVMTAPPDAAMQRRISLFNKILSPAPEFELSQQSDENRFEVENFIHQKFQQSYAADIHEFFPELLCMRCFGNISGTAGMRVAKNNPLFLEQYLSQPVEAELSQLAGKIIARDTIVEIGNLASSQRGASHLLFLLFTSILYRADYRWITFTATKALHNNLNKLGFNLVYLCDADPAKLNSDSIDDWGKYYDTQPQVLAGNLEDAAQIIESRPLYRRLLRLYRHRINYLAKEFKASQHG